MNFENFGIIRIFKVQKNYGMLRSQNNDWSDDSEPPQSLKKISCGIRMVNEWWISKISNILFRIFTRFWRLEHKIMTKEISSFQWTITKSSSNRNPLNYLKGKADFLNQSFIMLRSRKVFEISQKCKWVKHVSNGRFDWWTSKVINILEFLNTQPKLHPNWISEQFTELDYSKNEQLIKTSLVSNLIEPESKDVYNWEKTS